MDHTPRQKSSENEPAIVKKSLSKGQYTAQVNISPKKQLNFSLNYIPKQWNNQGPKKQQNVTIVDGPKSFPQSPRKTIQRYKPVAENKIQTDIVNAIVARDAKASMKRNNAIPGSTKLFGERRGTSPLKGQRNQSSPRKLLPKGITRRQAFPTHKEFTNGVMSPRKARKTFSKPLSLPKDKVQSQRSLIKPLVISESSTEATETKMEELKLTDDKNPISEDKDPVSENKDPVSDDVKHLECPKPDIVEAQIISPDLSIDNKKEGKSKKSIKPPGPLVKRSPFKNIPRFNKKQHSENCDPKAVDKGIKLDGKKHL